MHAGQVDARREEVGVPGEPLGGQDPSVRQPPEPDAVRIDVVAAVEVETGRQDVVVLGVALSVRVRGDSRNSFP